MKTAWLPAVPALAFLLAASSADAKLGPNPASLPAPTLPPPLVARDAPAAIGAGETMDGVSIIRTTEPRIAVVQHLPTGGRPTGNRSLGGETQRGPVFETIAAGPGRCIAFPANDAELDANLMMMSNAGVVPIRSERLVEGSDGGMTLEIEQGWLDAGTMGARSVSRSALPLVELGRGPGDGGHGGALAVYGYRTEEGVEVLVPVASSMVFRDAEGSVGTSRCGFARLVLPAYKTASTVVAVGPWPAPPPPMTPAPAATPMTPAPATTPAPVAGAPVSRNVQVSVSLSKMSRDPAPVLSVSVTWADDGSPASPEGAANPSAPQIIL
jgi:hypothetical protein